MMNHAETFPLLNDYVDGDLTLQQQVEVEKHIRSCRECQEEVRQLRSLLFEAAKLSRIIEPERDLWFEVKNRITHRTPVLPLDLHHGMHVRAWTKRFAAAAAAVLLAIGSFYLASEFKEGWEVHALHGKPKVGDVEIRGKSTFYTGQILVTDADSRARIDIGLIGRVEVEPRSRVKLLDARRKIHRLALDAGTIHAVINAPPRIFVVETPSATAIDLGCEYTLLVAEDGSGILRVTSGWVSLEFAERRSIIPAGAYCETRPGIGPGTPIRENANEAFRSAVRAYDFESGGEIALRRILATAGPTDALSLWHLIPRVTGREREQVVNTLWRFIPPPPSVTKEGLLQVDEHMMREWFDAFGLRGPWWNTVP